MLLYSSSCIHSIQSLRRHYPYQVHGRNSRFLSAKVSPFKLPFQLHQYCTILKADSKNFVSLLSAFCTSLSLYFSFILLSGDRCNFAVPWIAVRHTASICMYDRVISNIHGDMVDIFISSILSTSFTVKD